MLMVLLAFQRYAFQHLDTSNDDRVNFKEYKARRKIFFKVLEMDPKFCTLPLTPEEEFEQMRTQSALDEVASANAKGVRSQHTKSTLHAAQEVVPFITFQSMCQWYRRALDNDMYGNNDDGPVDVNQFLNDTNGIIVDIDEFQDLLLNCHYKTRITLPTPAYKAAEQMQKAPSTSKLVQHQQTPV